MNLDQLRQAALAKVQQIGQSFTNFTHQNPVPNTYIGGQINNQVQRIAPQVQNTFNSLGNSFNTGAQSFNKPVISPLPNTPVEKITDGMRNIVGETGKQIIQSIPSTIASMVRTNPVAQLTQQVSGVQNPSLQPEIQKQRLTDVYKTAQGVGLATTGIGTQAVGGGVNLALQGVINKMQGNPFLKDYAQNFAQGVMGNAPFGPIEKGVGFALNAAADIQYKPLQKLVSAIEMNKQPILIKDMSKNIPPSVWIDIGQRAITKGVQGAAEGAAFGAIQPLENGQTREQAIANSAAQFAILGALMQAGGDINTVKLKPIAENIGLAFKDAKDFFLGKGFTEKDGKLIKPRTPGMIGYESSVKLPDVKVESKPSTGGEIGGKKQPVVGESVSSSPIISEARKQIGTAVKEDKRPIRQVLSDAYTQWVDRYNPVVKKTQEAKGFLKTKSAQLRPEYDPEVLLRRLTGAGGIADTRYQTELKPVIDQLDNLKIDKIDMDAYMANKRIAGFGQVGRDVYGADPVKAQQVVQAMEQKYGTQISQLADQLYAYQDKGLQEMVQAGFISPESAKAMRGQNPDYAPLKRVMDDVSNYIGLPTRKLQQGTSPVFKIKGSTRQIDSPIENIIANTFQQRAAIEKNRIASSIANLQNIADVGFKQVKESSPNTITVWKNGQKEYWDVGKEIAETVKGVNEENMNVVLKILQAPASLLRQGATGRNPEFMLPNIIRDQLDAGVSSKYGYIPFVDYISGLKSVLTEDKAYQSWAQSGAKIDLGEMSGRKSITDSFNQANKKQGLFRWFTNMLDVMGKYSEQPTRVGLYKKAMQKTGNELLAMMESRDATVDFARMGSKMKVANSIIPFLNVGVQGFDKLIRSVKDNPAKVALLGATYAAAPQIMSQIYNLTNHPEEYAKIPQYVKDSNFVFVVGRNEKGNVDYVTIPKGNITPVVANPIQSYVDYLYKVDGQSFKQMAMSLISDTLPVLSPGGSLQEIATKTIGSNIPQAVKPLAENLLNKSFFKYDPKKEQSKEIVPSYIQKKPAYQQSYEWTPQMYKTIGAVFNASPLKIQNLMEGYLAGYVKIPAQIIDAAISISRGDKVDANDKTILRRFLQETIPSSNKPAPAIPEAPPLMERITGKASAAEKTQTEEQIHTKDIAARDKLRYSKNTILEENGKIYLKKNTESGVSINTIDPSFQPTKPEITGLAELDKKAKDKYNGEITQKANDIYDLYKASVSGEIKPGEPGYLTKEQANTLLTQLSTIKNAGKTKKLKKIQLKPVSKLQLKSYKNLQKIKLSSPPKIKMPQVLPSFLTQAPQAPNFKAKVKFNV